MVKDINKNPTANILLNGKRSNAFPLRLGTSQGCSLSPCLFNMVLEVSLSAIRQEKEVRSKQVRKEETKLPLNANTMMAYVEKFQGIYKTPPRIHK